MNNKAGKTIIYYYRTKLNKIVKEQYKISKFNFFLSISDEKKYSIAYVILQKKKK